MSDEIPSPPGASPLSEEEKREFFRAGEKARSILKAERAATFNGCTIGFFAALTLLFSLSSPITALLGFGMAVVAWNEFRGREMIRHLDSRGPQLLGRNQLGFMALLIVYCLWSIARTRTHSLAGMEELEEVLGPVEDLAKTLAIYFYASVIVLTAVFQGLMARYYFARVGMMDAYMKDTPAWIVDLQRRGLWGSVR
ncbi:hypothetical protein ACFL3S_00385 [Gemmatimonadota bacterium]